MTSQQIRRQFLDFFASKGHAFVPSSPVVPHDDPTLMFTNAGMNQFKPIFLGAARPDHPRVANSQKCIRAGGKHNDLDDVGQDTYHHTFFEMLGNWSFGDYFKKEAIEWAWELLTEVWGIDKSRLHATYFGGQQATKPRSDEATEGRSPIRQSTIDNRQSVEWELEPDYEARDLWLSVTDIDPSHVHPGSMKDNFWEMGETGPCGPCSEIHIDLTPDKSGRELVNKGDARVIELWNLVFIQFNRASDGNLTPLPAKHVDTGMGFERLCAMLQGMERGRIGAFSNYDTDIFTPLFEAIQKRTGAPPHQGTLPSDEATKRRSDGEPQSTIDNRQSTIMRDVSYRVIADHLRCLVFALTDGAIPSNEGRGYVLRSILRRAFYYGRVYMHMREPFLCDLVHPLVEHMGDVFSELLTSHAGKNVKYVADLIRDEEELFIKTLDHGLKLGSLVCTNAVAKPYANVLGEAWVYAGPDPIAFFENEDETLMWLEASQKLNFINKESRELKKIEIQDAMRQLQERGLSIRINGETAFWLHDTHGFPIGLTQLLASAQGLAVDIAEYERLMEEARERARSSSQVDDVTLHEELEGMSETEFTGYQELIETDTFVEAILRGTKFGEQKLSTGEEGALILQRTPFYAEQGGQVGDLGVIEGTEAHWRFRVANTKKVGGVVLHYGQCEVGSVLAYVDHETSAIPSTGRVHDVFETAIQKASCARAIVDARARDRTARNHTATHILNWALREVLGEHVQQKGSLVDPEKTRFDFSHLKQLSTDELAKIEHHVKSQISNALPVLTNPHVEQKKAREINTLRAVFGEKYPERVRVVSIGGDIDAMLRDPKNAKWMHYSVEFCGGTHLKNSKEAEEFVLVHEEAVAKGVRRLVGLTGEKAKEARQRGEFFLEVSGRLRTEGQRSKVKGQKGAGPHSGPYDLTRLLRELSEATIPVLTRHRLAEEIAVLQESAKEDQKKSVAAAQRGAVEAVGDLLAAHAIDVNGVTVVVGEVPGGNADALRSGIDYVRNKRGSSAVLLATVENGKVTLVAGMSRDVVDRGVKAGDLIKEICPLVGGRGGGRPDMAQGGGNDPKGLPKALDRARGWLGEKLS